MSRKKHSFMAAAYSIHTKKSVNQNSNVKNGVLILPIKILEGTGHRKHMHKWIEELFRVNTYKFQRSQLVGKAKISQKYELIIILTSWCIHTRKSDVSSHRNIVFQPFKHQKNENVSTIRLVKMASQKDSCKGYCACELYFVCVFVFYNSIATNEG